MTSSGRPSSRSSGPARHAPARAAPTAGTVVTTASYEQPWLWSEPNLAWRHERKMKRNPPFRQAQIVRLLPRKRKPVAHPARDKETVGRGAQHGLDLSS